MSHVFQKLQTTTGSCQNRSVAIKEKKKEIHRLGISNLMWGALKRGEEPDTLVILYKYSARYFDEKLVFLPLWHLEIITICENSPLFTIQPFYCFSGKNLVSVHGYLYKTNFHQHRYKRFCVIVLMECRNSLWLH